MTPAQIVSYIQLRRLPLTSEKRAQDALEQEFRASGISYRREVRLNDSDIIDFMVGSVGLEMKVKGRRREIYRQIERYCASDRIESLVLATSLAMGMPPTVNGKKIHIVSLARAWL